MLKNHQSSLLSVAIDGVAWYWWFLTGRKKINVTYFFSPSFCSNDYKMWRVGISTLRINAVARTIILHTTTEVVTYRRFEPGYPCGNWLSCSGSRPAHYQIMRRRHDFNRMFAIYKTNGEGETHKSWSFPHEYLNSRLPPYESGVLIARITAPGWATSPWSELQLYRIKTFRGSLVVKAEGRRYIRTYVFPHLLE